MRLFELDTPTTNIDFSPYIKYFEYFYFPPIYRGIRRTSPTAFVFDPKSFERKSANTSNEYNLLVSNYPTWN